MSEFTEISAFLSEAETLSDLRAQLVESLGNAVLPFSDWPFEALDSDAATAQYWAGLPKPQWVVFGTVNQADPLLVPDLAPLAEMGPVYRLSAEEDFRSWALEVFCKDDSWAFSFLEPDIGYREATLDVPTWADHGSDDSLDKMAACLRVEADALQQTFVADGGEQFSKLLGAFWEQMFSLNTHSLEIEDGQVVFGYDDF